ncbi:MobA/MobL family protein, partial [Psychrobacter celer]|uniref:MobA/MobL family protein n=1 Tax=Psychrobacter celer TaxID=306572 RepID=UPI003FD29EEA
MAIGRLSVGVGPKGKAGPHAMYIAREGKYAKHNEKIEKLEATGSGNMPDWAQADPNFFWKMSDEHERKNGTSYREHVISLPRELTPEQRHELIKEWIEQEIGEKHAYQYAIHNPLALDGGEQPHAHIMFSERLRDGIERDPDTYFKRYNSKNPERGGGKKANEPKLADERKLELKEQRDRWEKLCNQHLELAGSDARISMKTLKEQGIDREPVNLSMQQIKRADVKNIYTDLLTARAGFKNAKSDSQAINIVNELRKIDKELHERASEAVDRASRAVDSYQRRFKTDRSRVNRSGGAKLSLDSAIREATNGTDYSKYITNESKQRVEESKRLTNESKQRVEASKQLATSADQKINERIAAQAAEKATQERLEQQAAEKATQERLEQQAAEKATQERLEQQAAEKATQ